jgi:hypothetical protein
MITKSSTRVTWRRAWTSKGHRLSGICRIMPPADTSRVGHLAPCVEFHRFFGAEDPMVACSGTVVVAQTFSMPRHTYQPRGPVPNDPGWDTRQKNGLAHAMGPDSPGKWGVRGEHGMTSHVPGRAACGRSSWEPPLMELMRVPAPRMGHELPLVSLLTQVLAQGCGSPSSN